MWNDKQNIKTNEEEAKFISHKVMAVPTLYMDVKLRLRTTKLIVNFKQQ
jgi:hypothetical protein